MVVLLDAVLVTSPTSPVRLVYPGSYVEYVQKTGTRRRALTPEADERNDTPARPQEGGAVGIAPEDHI
jgi:hypothetical protein